MQLTAGGAPHRIPASLWAAAAFLLAGLAVLPGSRPRADLAAVCPLEPAGRFGAFCDLSRAAGGPDCCTGAVLMPGLLLVAVLGAVCIGVFLFASGLPETFRPICTVLKTPWPL